MARISAYIRPHYRPVTRPLQYRKGKKLPVTREWVSRVVAALEARHKTFKWLEGELGVSTGTLNRLLHKQASSILVEPVCRILEIDPPIDDPDPVYVELIQIIRRWTPEQRLAWIAVLRSHSKKPSE